MRKLLHRWDRCRPWRGSRTRDWRSRSQRSRECRPDAAAARWRTRWSTQTPAHAPAHNRASRTSRSARRTNRWRTSARCRSDRTAECRPDSRSCSRTPCKSCHRFEPKFQNNPTLQALSTLQHPNPFQLIENFFLWIHFCFTWKRWKRVLAKNITIPNRQ